MGIACRDVACRVRVGCVLQVACGRTTVVETHDRVSLRWDGLKTDDFPINFYCKKNYICITNK